jgi:quercetin dioxygenase-like cupin family protein
MANPRQLAGPSLVFDLAAEVSTLWREAADHTASVGRTLVKEPTFRVVLTVIKAGYRCEPHRTAASVSLHTISGNVRVHTARGAFDLPAGHLLALEHDVLHDVEGLEDSAFLQTIAWPARTGT